MNALRLPLTIDAGPFGHGRGILDADGRQVAFVACHTASLARTPDDGRQIAAAIVRAVNTHAQLLDALRRSHGDMLAMGRTVRTLDVTSACSEHWTMDGNEHGPEYVPGDEYIRAAIAAAEAPR